MSKNAIAITTVNLAASVLAGELNDRPVSAITADANILGEAAGGKVLKKDKNKDAAVERMTENAQLVQDAHEGKAPAEAAAAEDAPTEKAKPKKKAEAKKPAAPKRRAIMFQVKHEDGKEESGKLINSVPAGTFSDVKQVVVDRELNEKAYFNADYFKKREIEVKVDPKAFETAEEK